MPSIREYINRDGYPAVCELVHFRYRSRKKSVYDDPLREAGGRKRLIKPGSRLFLKGTGLHRKNEERAKLKTASRIL